MTLSGRKVLITGTNRGVGASFVEAALARQASTVYAAARNPALLPRFSDPARVVPVRLDVEEGGSPRRSGSGRSAGRSLLLSARGPHALAFAFRRAGSVRRKRGGWVKFASQQRAMIGPGEVVYVPVGVRHWHGRHRTAHWCTWP